MTDYFQSEVRLVWVLYPDSSRVFVSQSPTMGGVALFQGSMIFSLISPRPSTLTQVST